MAFDEHRNFQSCIFCGSTANLTKEHIFGKKVAERFPVKHLWKTPGKNLLGPTVAQGGGPIMSVTARLACDPCNTGPLSKIMQGSLEPLMSLIEGKSFRITPLNLAALSRYWERVGLIVDVMTSNYQLTENYKGGDEYELSKEHRQAPPRYFEDQRKAWTKVEKLPDMHVYVGFHGGVLGLNPCTHIVPGLEIKPGQRRPTKRPLMTIGNLSVCIWMAERPLPVPKSLRDLADNQHWDWPGMVAAVSYEDFFGLYYQSPEVKAIVELIGDSGRRQKIEEYSKQVGSFELPPDLEPLLSDLVVRHKMQAP